MTGETGFGPFLEALEVPEAPSPLEVPEAPSHTDDVLLELQVMNEIVRALQTLPGDDSRRQVLGWISDRFGESYRWDYS